MYARVPKSARMALVFALVALKIVRANAQTQNFHLSTVVLVAKPVLKGLFVQKVVVLPSVHQPSPPSVLEVVSIPKPTIFTVELVGMPVQVESAVKNPTAHVLPIASIARENVSTPKPIHVIVVNAESNALQVTFAPKVAVFNPVQTAQTKAVLAVALTWKPVRNTAVAAEKPVLQANLVQKESAPVPANNNSVKVSASQSTLISTTVENAKTSVKTANAATKENASLPVPKIRQQIAPEVVSIRPQMSLTAESATADAQQVNLVKTASAPVLAAKRAAKGLAWTCKQTISIVGSVETSVPLGKSASKANANLFAPKNPTRLVEIAV